MGYYSKDHYRRTSQQPAATSEEIADTLRRQAAGKQALAETRAKFGPIIIGENFAVACDYQQERFEAILTELRSKP